MNEIQETGSLGPEKNPVVLWLAVGMGVAAMLGGLIFMGLMLRMLIETFMFGFNLFGWG